MNYPKMRRKVLWGCLAAALCAQAQDVLPPETGGHGQDAVMALSSEVTPWYHNMLPPRITDAGTFSAAVQMGVGNGIAGNGVVVGESAAVSFGGYGEPTLSQVIYANSMASLGSPVAARFADTWLGESIKPPAGWNGQAPSVTSRGGTAVWLDYAGLLLTTGPGAITVEWPVGDIADKQFESKNYTIAESANKRPVRMYWTHHRPGYKEMSGKVMEKLQNAGPTIQFSSNYRVDLYGSQQIKVFKTGDDMTYNDWE